MANAPDFDLAVAHKHFSGHCFNQSWKLIDEDERSADEDIQLVALGHASLWHWTQRSDCTDTNLSVAHWLLSRIYAVVGEPAQARKYGESCLRISERDGVPPFYLGFAYEALARAASQLEDGPGTERFLQLARDTANEISKPESQKMLLDDLATITQP